MASTTIDPDASISFRSPRKADGPTLWALAKDNGLDENSPYAYLLWTEYFAGTTVVATAGNDDDTPVGFVIGFLAPEDPETVFVWQIGVDRAHRRKGIAGRILDTLVERTGASYVESTVTPSNTASRTLFSRLGERNGTEVSIEPLFGEELFPPGHEAEERFRIGPIGTGTAPDGEARG